MCVDACVCLPVLVCVCWCACVCAVCVRVCGCIFLCRCARVSGFVWHKPILKNNGRPAGSNPRAVIEEQATATVN